MFLDPFGRVLTTDTTINRQASGESLSETFTTETIYDGAGGTDKLTAAERQSQDENI
jgi:hypothetical protein